MQEHLPREPETTRRARTEWVWLIVLILLIALVGGLVLLLVINAGPVFSGRGDEPSANKR